MSFGKHEEVTADWGSWTAGFGGSKSMKRFTMKIQFNFRKEESSCAITSIWYMQVNKCLPSTYAQERYSLKMKYVSAPAPPNFLLFCANEVRTEVYVNFA